MISFCPLIPVFPFGSFVLVVFCWLPCAVRLLSLACCRSRAVIWRLSFGCVICLLSFACCYSLAVIRLLSFARCHSLAVIRWLSFAGCGSLAAVRWLRFAGCGSLAAVRWLWFAGCVSNAAFPRSAIGSPMVAYRSSLIPPLFTASSASVSCNHPPQGAPWLMTSPPAWRPSSPNHPRHAHPARVRRRLGRRTLDAHHLHIAVERLPFQRVAHRLQLLASSP